MFKIINIKGCKTCKQLLIAICRDDEGNDFVELAAWHEDKDGVLYYQIENVTFDNEIMARRYIADFQEISANEFVNSFNF